jgi:cyclophilin family peptidyl-prolyl cis-trans isomerase/HEAT repeat protein
MKPFAAALLPLLFLALSSAQVPVNTSIQILKAEDVRRYDPVLANLLNHPNVDIRKRATLAAGRIGNDQAVAPLAKLLDSDPSSDVRTMAAFALGEIESIKAADAILRVLNDKGAGALRAETQAAGSVQHITARAVEAAGKIAAANAKDPKAKELGKAILDTLQTTGDRETILLALPAALRARPPGTDGVVARFLINADPRIRADAANTLSRIRAKNANEALRSMLQTDTDTDARANAARALGAADDKGAFDILLKSAIDDSDSKVRVSAIRALGSLRDVKAAPRLMGRGETLLEAYKFSKYKNPSEKNELIEIASALGRLLALSDDPRAIKLLSALVLVDNGQTPEFSIARMRVNPSVFDSSKSRDVNWRELSTAAQTVAELAVLDLKSDEAKKLRSEAPGLLKDYLQIASARGRQNGAISNAMPDLLRAYARFKTDDLHGILIADLQDPDLFVRATAAELLAAQPSTKETVDALNKAFSFALVKDKTYNDAQLATLDALYKLDKKAGTGTFLVALDAPDYLVRKKAFELLADKDIQIASPGVPNLLDAARAKHKDEVLPFAPTFGTKLGQVLNNDSDYRRALSRKNGSVKAVVTTEKGVFTIDFIPEDAPLTVDNFIKLARANYFNGLEVHRVVPDFVMQDGDPRGDGNGGPGWSIRCEINMIPYDRGAVGMALSGKDTGGSQWFVTHAPQPHLDGGYTVFGRVNETDMKGVDMIVRGDKILSVRIVEGLPQRTQRKK